MTTAQLILIIVLVAVAAVLVALILRRGAARREERRVEAEGLRAQADEVAASLPGQEAFVEQAEERAGVARAEAEAAARQAARLEGEAADQRERAEDSRREYEAVMRRADDLDPDVKESAFPPVDGEGERPMTRAERRRAREEAEARGEEATWATGPAAPVPGAAAAAAAGSATWAGHRAGDATDEEEERSARIASAADYRDDTVAEPRQGESDVSSAAPVGTQGGMSETSEHERHPDQSEADAADVGSRTDEPGAPGEHDAPGQDDGTTSGMSMVSDPDAYAATEPVLVEDSAPPVEPKRPADAGTGVLEREPGSGTDEATGSEELPTAGATPDEDADAADVVSDEDADAVILTDTESYAATEPVLSDGSHAEAHERPSSDTDGDTAEESVLEPGAEADAPASEVAEEPTEERYDPTPERDWAADEGALLDENRTRGEELAADRATLEQESEASPVAEASRSRRVSEFHEIRDGGYGVGSAAPLEDGAQPLDHPVAAYRDTMTFRMPDDPGYDDADPDVWFYDEGAAERSGFRRSEG